MKKIGISVVNFRTPMLVKNLITSIIEADVKNTKLCIVIVDNDSGDDSVQFLSSFVKEQGLSETVSIISATRNGGYAFGNNLAIKQLLGQGCDYIWLLNPDTRVLPGACEKLVECLEASPEAGIAGSCLQDADGSGQIASFNFPSPMGEFVNLCGIDAIRKRFFSRVVAAEIPATRQEVDWVAGASMMVKPELFAEVGLMDEAYFLYFEEVDFCLQVRKAGYEIYFEPQSKVVHLVGAATGISDSRKQAPRRPKYWFDSRRRYFQKNHGMRGALVSEVMGALGYIANRLKKFVKREKDLGPPHFLGDFIRYSSVFQGAVERQPKRQVNREKPSVGLRQLIKEDWAANGRDWSRPGFRAMAVYRFGVWRMTVRNRLLRAPLSLIYLYLYRYVRNHYGIEMPFSVRAGRRIVIEHQHGIVIHGNSIIGDDCIIRQGVTLGNRNLEKPYDAPILGNSVNVGAGAKLLGPIRVGDNATIGANAVVLTDVPEGALAVGVPAEILKSGDDRKATYGKSSKVLNYGAGLN